MRGQPYEERREAVKDWLTKPLPELTLGEIARREGVSPDTVRKVMDENNIDTLLYRERVNLVNRRRFLIKDIRSLEVLIQKPITKEQ